MHKSNKSEELGDAPWEMCKSGKTICMVGVCGAGMAPLAIYLAQKGCSVYGWDDHVNLEIKDLLVSNGVVFMVDKVPPIGCDCVVRSSAINVQTDETCQMAAQSGIKICRRGEFLAGICPHLEIVAVVGSHGKTSVTANCVEISKFNLNWYEESIDFIVGGFFSGNGILPAEKADHSSLIVMEVDESDGTMECFSPDYTIALNYDDDHVSNYGTRENFLRAFEDLFARTKSKIFLPENEPTFTKMASKFPGKCSVIKNLNLSDFTERNREIALFCMSNILGKDFRMPSKFVGIQRRNDVMFRTDKFVLLNDYAHHPTEIEALLKYVRAHYQDYELNIVFQPHRLTRTKQYFAEFAAILDQFDRQFVVELYAAFEEKIDGVSSDLVFDNVKSGNKKFLPLANFNAEMHAIFRALKAHEKKQLIMFVGAGNILSHAKKFVNEVAFGEVEHHLLTSNTPFAVFADLTNSFSIRVATSARIRTEPTNLENLAGLLSLCRNLGLRCLIVGNGTKILPPDSMINAVVVFMKSDYWRRWRWISNDLLYCASGIQMRDFCDLVRKRLFTGVEKLAYIPSTIGGAIAMNSGSHGQAIFDHLISLEVMDPDGHVWTIERTELNFGYRMASLPTGNVVISATFRFKKTAPNEYFEKTAKELLEWRRGKQPGGANFGSVFKNGVFDGKFPSGSRRMAKHSENSEFGDNFSAGEVIDRAGFKGYRIGDAAVSDSHANFIVNCAHASAQDVEKIIDTIRCEVAGKFNIFLHTEVRILR
jgi:UDP-N-acetylenolpyruvoylglucosamine reductase